MSEESEKYQRKLNYMETKIIPDLKNTYQDKDTEI